MYYPIQILLEISVDSTDNSYYITFIVGIIVLEILVEAIYENY